MCLCAKKGRKKRKKGIAHVFEKRLPPAELARHRCAKSSNCFFVGLRKWRSRLGCDTRHSLGRLGSRSFPNSTLASCRSGHPRPPAGRVSFRRRASCRPLPPSWRTPFQRASRSRVPLAPKCCSSPCRWSRFRRASSRQCCRVRHLFEEAGVPSPKT